MSEPVAAANVPPRMTRAEAVPRLIGDHRDFLFIGGLAGAAKDIHSITGGGPNAFLMAGAMGSSLCMGLGLALAQPERHVLVVTGDGELLMNLGALATVGFMAPARYAVLCVDNELYGETGNQITHTSRNADLEAIARGCGIKHCTTVTLTEETEAASALLRTDDGPAFVCLKVDASPPPKTERPRSFDSAERKVLFRRDLLGEV